LICTVSLLDLTDHRKPHSIAAGDTALSDALAHSSERIIKAASTAIPATGEAEIGRL
jgi:hypothetical protein